MRAAAALCVAALTGCQTASSGAGGPAATSGQNRLKSGAAVAHSDGVQPVSWSVVLPAVNTQSLLKGLSSLPRASISATGRIALHGADYRIHLTQPSILQYTETENGILWTCAPQDPSIDYTPFTAQKGESKTGFSLRNGSLVLENTVPGAKVTLYDVGGYALYSQKIANPRGYPLIRLDAATLSGAKLRLYEGALSPSSQLMVAPAKYGVAVALVDRSGPLPRLSGTLWANLQTQTEQPITRLTWPLWVTQTPAGEVLVRAGGLDTQIAPAGQITRRWRTTFASSLTAPFSKASFRYAVVPSAGFLPVGQAVVYCSLQNKTRYTMTLKTVRGALIGVLTGLWGTQSSPGGVGKPAVPFGPALTSRGTAPSSRRPPSIPAFFGRLRVLHDFYLQSREGLWIQWLETVPRQDGTATPLWYARFSSRGWLYTVGPFKSLANRSEVSRLTALLKYAKAQAPAAPAAAGTVYLRNAYIRLAPDSHGMYAESQLEFPVRRQLSVTLRAPGLSALPLSAFLVSVSTPQA